MNVGLGKTAVKPVHLIGVPLDLGAGRRGVDMGPSAFRIAGIRDQIAALGRVVVDKFVTHEFSFNDLEQAFELFHSRRDNVLKVMLNYDK